MHPSFPGKNATGQEMELNGEQVAVLDKARAHLLPILMLCYFAAFLDRVNIGFAALDMNGDLHLSATVFGTGAGLFFLGYVLFEIPSNLLLVRVGARLWIARIMITWGIVSACTAFVVGRDSFFLVRVLLGAAEAGFFPGMLFYCTLWFPRSYRGRIYGLTQTAVPISSVIRRPALLAGPHHAQRRGRAERLAMAVPDRGRAGGDHGPGRGGLRCRTGPRTPASCRRAKNRC